MYMQVTHALVTRMTGICVSQVFFFFFGTDTMKSSSSAKSSLLFFVCTLYRHVDERQQSLSRLRHTRILRVSINAVIVWIAIHILYSFVSDVFKC